jgi:SAM-dependent methyltransferase
MTASTAKPALYDSWADFYDLTDADHGACVAFYRGLVQPGMRLMLDLGCGTGVNTCAIAEALPQTKRVVALDSSERMLALARKRDPAIGWVRADFRVPPVDGPFDFVLCCFNTLQMIPREELSALFSRVHALLAPGAVFAFDIYQPNLAYLNNPPHDRLAKVVIDSDQRRLETREDASYDPTRGVLLLNWRLQRTDTPACEPLARLSLEVHQHFPQEIEECLRGARLAIEARYGDFDRSEFTPASRKQILVCRAAR